MRENTNSLIASILGKKFVDDRYHVPIYVSGESPETGPMWELGPLASKQYPLLTDDQVLCLL